MPSIHFEKNFVAVSKVVLNLVINGMPSILRFFDSVGVDAYGFKPCYKWNAFNTIRRKFYENFRCSFKPCYKWNAFNTIKEDDFADQLSVGVLNLVINGMPSIHHGQGYGLYVATTKSFKPCYKWNAFNTKKYFTCV